MTIEELQKRIEQYEAQIAEFGKLVVAAKLLCAKHDEKKRENEDLRRQLATARDAALEEAAVLLDKRRRMYGAHAKEHHRLGNELANQRCRAAEGAAQAVAEEVRALKGRRIEIDPPEGER